MRRALSYMRSLQYTRDKDHLFYLEGGERRRAPENVQGLPEGEGGGVGTL